MTQSFFGFTLLKFLVCLAVTKQINAKYKAGEITKEMATLERWTMKSMRQIVCECT